MGRAVRYVTRVETRVTVSEVLLSGGEVRVGEFVVRAEQGKDTREPSTVEGQVEAAMQRNIKQAKMMAAAVTNTERNRLK